jgi:hypothetical protein
LPNLARRRRRPRNLIIPHTKLSFFTCPRTHSFTRSLTHSPARSLIHSLTLSPTHSPAHSPAHSPTHSLAHSLTCLLSHPPTYSLAHALARSFFRRPRGTSPAHSRHKPTQKRTTPGTSRHEHPHNRHKPAQAPHTAGAQPSPLVPSAGGCGARLGRPGCSASLF